MATRRVNPPQQKIPKDLAKRDPELFKYLEDQQFFNFQVWKLSIDNITNIDVNLGGGSRTRALFAKLQQQIGSGDEITIDSTGFTIDSSLFTIDMSEA